MVGEVTAAAAESDNAEVASKAAVADAEFDGPGAAVRMAVVEATSDVRLVATVEVDGSGAPVRRIIVEGGTLVGAASEAASDKADGSEPALLVIVTEGGSAEVVLATSVESDACEAVRLARMLDASSGERV